MVSVEVIVSCSLVVMRRGARVVGLLHGVAHASGYNRCHHDDLSPLCGHMGVYFRDHEGISRMRTRAYACIIVTLGA